MHTPTQRGKIVVVASVLALLLAAWFTFHPTLSTIPYTSAHHSAATATMAAKIDLEIEQIRQRLDIAGASNHVIYGGGDKRLHTIILGRETPMPEERAPALP